MSERVRVQLEFEVGSLRVADDMLTRFATTTTDLVEHVDIQAVWVDDEMRDVDDLSEPLW